MNKLILSNINTDVGVLPFQCIKQLREGKIINTRVWNNMFKWRPRFSSVYILHKTILLELLGSVRV